MEHLLRPSVTSWGIVPLKARPCTCDWRLGICARWPSPFRAAGTVERRRTDDTWPFGFHSGVFVPPSVRLRPVYRSEAGFGSSFRYPSAYAAMPGFLSDQHSKYPDLDAAAFQAWCHTHEHVTSGVRRVRMLEVCAFCLYRRRTEPQCFVPDPTSFPPYHQ